jgi:Raf kinase inhibitor-like YbhB/YbcL family protein
MRLESPAFQEGGWIPQIHTGDGRDLSPPLMWSEVPEQVRSFVLILDDPDAPAGLWVHWVLFDIPADVHELPAGLPRSPILDNGSRQGRCWGVTSFSRMGYHGPMPPPGPPHRYRLSLWALDRKLALPARATAAEVRTAIGKHALAETVLTGMYGRAQPR